LAQNVAKEVGETLCGVFLAIGSLEVVT